MDRSPRLSARAQPAAWEAHSQVVAMGDGALYVVRCSEPSACAPLLQRLAAGESPHDVLGGTAKRIPLDRVSSVAWVPSLHLLIVRMGWWKEPWRITFESADSSEAAFTAIAGGIPGEGTAVQSRVGPHDLPLDQQKGLGIFLGFMALLTLLLGALEGTDGGPVAGPAAKFRIFAELGQQLGVVGAVIVISLALVLAGAGFVWWYRRWPLKWVVHASA
ncbi:MAG: hypothetical protein JSS02_17250 [Planctomycetes bacterium]|nr:hypothetical protein [Planctomycetota bacterium]